MIQPSYKQNDVFLLFKKLPYDFHSGYLPIKILENLYFYNTPSELLEPKYFHSSDDIDGLLEYASVVNMILPGHTLPGMGIIHCCLRYDSNAVNQYPDFKPSTLFSNFIISLRLQKPCPIIIGGQFEVGPPSELIKNPTFCRLLTSPHNPKPKLQYSKKDIKISSEISKDLLKISELKNESRIRSALIYFGQVSLGLSNSLQLCYLGLWAALEAIFKPTGNKKAETIARRIATYLSAFNLPEDIEEWLKTEYIHRRSRFIHGSHIAPPLLQDIRSGSKAFPMLHEITRLCLLGFLSLEESEQEQLSRCKGKKLQQKLDGLGQAKGNYLNQQKMYL
jgi:hypothetical protein